MKTNILLILLIITTGCSKTIEYTPEFIKATSGRYLFSPDETIEVTYKDNTLLLNWRGKENIEPIHLNNDVFFVKELNKKMQFLKHTETNAFYLTDIPEGTETNANKYFKMADSVEVPSFYLKNKQYDKALKGYLAIQKEDSNSVFVEEHMFNRYGYKFMNDKNYKDAIEVFKLNIALYPTSDNVYDSLADAYARSGDSAQALENYKKALKYNTGNRHAKRFIKAYNKND